MFTSTNGELFWSDDRGEAWTPIGVRAKWPLPYARGIAVKTDDPRVLFAGCGQTTTGETGGVLRSSDGGQTWQSLPLPVRPNATMWGLATHPADADRVVAWSLFGEVYLTEDAGESWRKIPREFGEIRHRRRGCPRWPSPARGAHLVYVGNTESNEIYVLQLDRQSGDLTLVEKVPIPGVEKPGGSTPMAVSPDRRFLYAATRGEPQIAAGFAIDPATGKLKHVASGPLADSLAYIATDRTGRFLLGASYPGHKVTVNPIGPPGTVQPPQQVLPDYPNAHSILPDAANRHVLVPTLGNDRVNQFTFDAATGKLTPAAVPAVEVKAKAGPRHLAFHPGGKLVYVLGELDGTVYVFDYDAGRGNSAAEAERQRAAVGLPGQALGRRSAHHA